ncbi:MAG: undecaprenyl-diphosphatase UppP [Anaerolineaceae bacterium]|nr:undecaprenyl-diphosphatase UppP [Anaerolineaceae bacterium]MBN2678293.1 undecaprenyl-diphosphatase UppP [Anaerolineaceae bacterium]
MTILQAIVLGIVQGLTEFLPISSSAHLVLVPTILGWNIPADFNFIFDVIVQMGTLIAVIIFFWKDIIEIMSAVFRSIQAKPPFKDPQARLGWLVVLATIPAGIIGLLIKPLVESAFDSPTITASMLILTAVILFISERIGNKSRELKKMNWVDALWIGLAQAAAIFPGISRSGATIGAGLLRNLKRDSAARFSFLMSIPIMIVSGLLEVRDFFGMPYLSEYLPALLAGVLTAAIVGYLAVRWLLGYLSKHTLYAFSIYCLAVAAIILIVLHA